MEYLIATITIMLFCIAALAQEKSPESAIIISKDTPRPLKQDKIHAKQTTKHICTAEFTDLPMFSGQLCFDVIPITGGRAVRLQLPAWYAIATAFGWPRQITYSTPALGSLMKMSCYVVVNKVVVGFEFIWQNALFCHEKITN
jgi:hypothetical protein